MLTLRMPSKLFIVRWKLVNDFSSGKKLKSEGFDKELREVAQNMTKITDAATRQAVQSAYDAVRAAVVESQEKELQQTKTDLVNAFLKTKSHVGHYAADGTYVPAGGTYIPPNPPIEAPAPGLPKTFTSSHGHRHRHAPQQQPKPTVQNPAPQQQPKPTVQNPAPQQQPKPTVQNPAPQQQFKIQHLHHNQNQHNNQQFKILHSNHKQSKDTKEVEKKETKNS
ncbi:hypothetical protein TVAG_123050 [Trichomonas vaginalis G3]|uniref:Uncharacterized protein n=1 Tax=Trichomonas vaginalis (strain ATCC PRA-98 / G3) TaxID=412133 RepID=A2DN62_TRIV3|nr:hypothetical protein TVAG_123050 [Trichomonas vaginalis G3]|eukprot:XP_001579225.1 hypothetical protein [Trichomonas vaginalis G3]